MANDTKQLIRELVDEVLDEMSSSGAAGPIATPFWGRGHKSKDAETLHSMPGGKLAEPGKDETDDTTIGESGENIVRRSLGEGRSRYRNFKESDMMKNHAKVSYGIREAKKMLGEVEYLLNLCERLKTESDIPTTGLWRRTKPDMQEIHKRLKQIAGRIQKMGK